MKRSRCSCYVVVGVIILTASTATAVYALVFVATAAGVMWCESIVMMAVRTE